MSHKRLTSPGPPSLMKNILVMTSEPKPSNKKIEVCHPQPREKMINHNYCYICCRGGEIICCERCPRSYHRNCHIPNVNEQPLGEWACRMCTSDEDDEFDDVPIINNADETENNLYQYDYSEQDKLDIDIMPKDFIDKFLRNCESPSNLIFENAVKSVGYYFFSNHKQLSNEFLEEVPIQRKYNAKLINRKQLDKLKMIRKSDICRVCKTGVLSGRLVQCNYCCQFYHLNCLDPPLRDWDHSMRWLCPLHNSFYEVAYPTIFPSNSGRVLTDSTTIKRRRCEFLNLPGNIFINIPSQIVEIYKKPEDNIPVASSENALNILCDIASCELKSFGSSNSADNSVELLVNQPHSRLLENSCFSPKQPSASLLCLSVPINFSIQEKSLTIGKHPKNIFCLQSYGNCEYISDNHATIIFDDDLGDFLVKNHSRHGIIVDNVSYFGARRPKDSSNSNNLKKINSQVKKFLNKKRKTIRKHEILRIYQNNENEKVVIKYVKKQRKFDYEQMAKYYIKKFQNIKHTYHNIECKCSKRLISNDGYAGLAVLHNGSIMSIGCMKFKFMCDSLRDVSNVCREELHGKTESINLNGIRLNFIPEQDIHNNVINNINDPPLVVINGNHSHENGDTNFINEQNISTFYLDDSEDHQGISDDIIILDENDRSSLDIDLSRSSNTSCVKYFNINNMTSNMYQSFANDLIQEVDEPDDDTTFEEEIVYDINYTETDNNATGLINNVQEWIIEEIIDDRNYSHNNFEHSNDLQLPSTSNLPVSDNSHQDYKTEHLYCVSKDNELCETIIISDDDEK